MRHHHPDLDSRLAGRTPIPARPANAAAAPAP